MAAGRMATLVVLLLLVLLLLPLLHALAVALDEALLAGHERWCIPRGSRDRRDRRPASRLSARSVTLVRGCAESGRGYVEEPAVDARVIDLRHRPVQILVGQRVVGEEVGVGAIGAGREEGRVMWAGASRDQAETVPGERVIVRVFVIGDAVSGARRLPLIYVFACVGIEQRNRVGRVEEHPAIVGQAETVRSEARVANDFSIRRTAGYALQ